MDHVVGVAEIADMGGEKGGQMMMRVNHDVGAGRPVPAELADGAGPAGGKINPGADAQGV